MPDISDLLHKPDPTLDALNKILESEQQLRTSKNIGFGAIGHECRRKIQYDINSEEPEIFTAETLRIFRNGHNDEALMIADLLKIPGIELHYKDPDRDNKQYKLDALGGRFTGRLDGVIKGIIQAPTTFHVYEHKSVNDKKFDKLDKLKIKLGEKEALREWDMVYFSQAQSAMKYTDLDRHYMTVSTPGLRRVTSVRTNYDKGFADSLERKAATIINAKEPLERISEDREYFTCKFCRHREMCHG